MNTYLAIMNTKRSVLSNAGFVRWRTTCAASRPLLVRGSFCAPPEGSRLRGRLEGQASRAAEPRYETGNGGQTAEKLVGEPGSGAVAPAREASGLTPRSVPNRRRARWETAPGVRQPQSKGPPGPQPSRKLKSELTKRTQIFHLTFFLPQRGAKSALIISARGFLPGPSGDGVSGKKRTGGPLAPDQETPPRPQQKHTGPSTESFLNAGWLGCPAWAGSQASCCRHLSRTNTTYESWGREKPRPFFVFRSWS